MTKKATKPNPEKIWMALADKIERGEKAARAADRKMLRNIKYGLRLAGADLMGTELAEILEIVQVGIGRKVMAGKHILQVRR